MITRLLAELGRLEMIAGRVESKIEPPLLDVLEMEQGCLAEPQSFPECPARRNLG
jgi:hypothetical protein